jgi:dihydroorotate dehydrogenase
MYQLLRPLLFRLDPERAHALTLGFLHVAGNSPITNSLITKIFSTPDKPVSAFGLTFKNRVGLAAGYDKNGVAVNGLAALGFGHIEVGTVTRLAQVGNPKPRVHRVPAAQAVVNAMGFPNDGMEALLLESRKWKVGLPATFNFPKIGINLGKGKDTPLENAAEDYCYLLEKVHARADYVAINLSSPNTPGLRQLQTRTYLESLLRAVVNVRNTLTPRVPLLVKLAPDLSEAELDEILAVVTTLEIDGLIATNTTVSRGALVPPAAQTLAGGLSGAPLTQRSTEIISYLARRTALPIIGVGGILSAADAQAKLDAGATLIQIYTGLVYAGPSLVKQINSFITQS